METITFTYEFEEDGDKKEVTLSKSIPAGLHDYDVCEMFFDFMKSVGFSEENVVRYFNE